MTEQTRRDALMIAALGALGAVAASVPNAAAITPTGDAALDAHRHDFAWLQGRWNVQHRRLKERLDDYYEYLAICAVHFRDKRFWTYHSTRLAELGYPLSVEKLAKAVCAKPGRPPVAAKAAVIGEA